MFFHFKYCLALKCIFLYICQLVFAETNTQAPNPKSQHNEEINILNGDVTKKLIVWSKGIIPYFIDDFSFDKVTRDKMRLYLGEVGSQTKLQFVELPRPPDDDKTRWVLFINRKGLLECDDYYATKFTKEGVQKVVVGYDCLQESGNGLAAAVLALAGVPPEHNSPNRDSFIKIEEKNIIPDKLHLFKIIEVEDWPFFNLDYDFSSASHYDFYMYSINGHMTINPKVQPIQTNGALSSSDIQKIRSVYDYISKESLVSHHDCSKMFRPGPKFNKSESLTSDIKATVKIQKMMLLQPEVKNRSTEDKLEMTNEESEKKNSSKEDEKNVTVEESAQKNRTEEDNNNGTIEESKAQTEIVVLNAPGFIQPHDNSTTDYKTEDEEETVPSKSRWFPLHKKKRKPKKKDRIAWLTKNDYHSEY